MNVTAVTVTYGKRAHLLTQALDAAKAEGIAQAVVIDNGADDEISHRLAGRYGGWARVHRLAHNLGSAAGFKTGIELALRDRAEFLLLLDDDNVLNPGSVKQLYAALNLQFALRENTANAVFCFRADRHQALINRAGARKLRTSSTFRGFHLLDIPAKFLNRIQPAPKPANPPATLPAACAPYGGLFFHRTLIEKIGLPRADFVLYEDDTEFTARLNRAGGCLLLIPGATLTDLETSWNHQQPNKPSCAVWLNGGTDLRTYYAFRNGTFSDLYCRGGNRALILLNMAAYVLVLTAFAIKQHRLARLMLLLRALAAGLTGRLGIAQSMQLAPAAFTPTDARPQDA
jgi:GT2 family glycosyltransferase